MRSITLPDAPPAHRGGPVASLDAQTPAAIGELRGIPQEGVDCDAAAAVWDEALRAPGWDGPPVWLHADLMPGNLPVDDGRLTSVIDFGCLGVGDPAGDLFPAWNLPPSDARQAFRGAPGVDDTTWVRGRGRTLSQAVIALPYHRRTNAAMAHNARHAIRAVLAPGTRSGRCSTKAERCEDPTAPPAGGAPGRTSAPAPPAAECRVDNGAADHGPPGQ
jgi:aminoglycoside phosphotransferase (APT) family kinase protein